MGFFLETAPLLPTTACIREEREHKAEGLETAQRRSKEGLRFWVSLFWSSLPSDATGKTASFRAT